MKLIEHWRSAWRLWSLQLAAAAWGLLILMQSWPESMLYLWNLLPDEARAILPQRFAVVFPILLGVASLIARIVKQPKKDKVDAGPCPTGQ